MILINDMEYKIFIDGDFNDSYESRIRRSKPKNQKAMKENSAHSFSEGYEMSEKDRVVKQVAKQVGEDVRKILNESDRKPHREICQLCHEVSRVGFSVPDDIWKASVHISHINAIICLSCFTRLADERGVQWDNDIKFYPVSRITHEIICHERKHS